MSERILGSRGGRRRRRLLLALVTSIAALAVFAITNALAVHEEEFQLDGNVADDAASAQDFDWASFFNSAGNRSPVLPDASRPGFDASSFDRDFSTKTNGDFSTADNTTFATGSKDTLNITPGWQCNQDNNVLSKNDVMNAYAVSYEAGGKEILYFGLERNANTGTADVGFWFLQDGTVNCESPGGSTAFTGNHRDGDLLVVSEFTQGGVVSTIQVYKWEGGADGALNETPVAAGVDCSTVTGSHLACGRVNTDTISTPWPTANKQDGVGTSLRISEFYEGGLNLTDSGLGGKCFNTFMADTRSSTSLTATLFDFSRGQLGQCTSTTQTQPVDNDGTAIPAGGLQIPGDPSDASILVKDKATVTVNGGSSFSGTLSFHLCGPFAANSSTLCSTGGVAVSSQTITASGTYTSGAATVTSAGRYCWRATFSGDSSAGVPGSSDSAATECFLVTPRTPTLTTDAGPVGSSDPPVDFGQPVTDTATLGNTAHQPGTGGPTGSTDGSIGTASSAVTLGGDADGSIKFTLYKDSTCTALATGTGTNPQTVNVTGNGTYGPVSFTPDAPGTYYWVAEYDGDLPNTNAASDTACDSADEKVVVRQIDTKIKTEQFAFPNDSATIESTVAGEALPAGGTVVFRLYGPTGGGTPKTAEQNCDAHGDTVGSGGLLYKETKSDVGGAVSVTTSTTNYPPDADAVSVSVSETYYWRVTYDPGGTKFTGRQSDCVENTVLTFNNDPFPGTLFPPPPSP
jgi:hypothetical protein